MKWSGHRATLDIQYSISWCGGSPLQGLPQEPRVFLCFLFPLLEHSSKARGARGPQRNGHNGAEKESSLKSPWKAEVTNFGHRPQFHQLPKRRVHSTFTTPCNSAAGMWSCGPSPSTRRGHPPALAPACPRASLELDLLRRPLVRG